jgi:hypothetical protein
MKTRINTLAVAVFAAAALSCLPAKARASIVWAEMGDAGQLPGTAQTTVGAGPLVAIQGNLAAIDDVDMFRIFISDLSLFSATTVSPNTELIDTQLFLFDEKGLGVAANGDTDLFGFETNATIPADSVSGPAGEYLLAVAQFNDLPTSSGGEIFPDLFVFSSSGEVVGPSGPGGADPVSGWSADGFSEPLESYEIRLTGALPVRTDNVIPEPVSLAIWGLGAAGLVAWQCGWRKGAQQDRPSACGIHGRR